MSIACQVPSFMRRHFASVVGTTLKGANEMRRRVIVKPYGNFFKIIFGALKILALHLARLRIFAYHTQFLKSSIDVIDRYAWYLPDLGNASVGKLNQTNTHPLFLNPSTTFILFTCKLYM